jgi:hypothetical protein
VDKGDGAILGLLKGLGNPGEKILDSLEIFFC